MATATKMTLAEFLALPEDKPANEFVCGEVIQKPMPTQGHSFIQMFLGVLLFQFLNQTKLGRAGMEWRCIFGPPGHERAFVPGLIYVARERLTRDRHHRAAPDLAIEILSPDQSASRFADKIQFYLLYGVRLVWAVDPEARTITVFAPGREARTLATGDTLDGEDVLPGFTVAVDDIFAQLQV
jgi:Uma2 family endonuclease